jgi:hypothetical protein
MIVMRWQTAQQRCMHTSHMLTTAESAQHSDLKAPKLDHNACGIYGIMWQEWPQRDPPVDAHACCLGNAWRAPVNDFSRCLLGSQFEHRTKQPPALSDSAKKTQWQCYKNLVTVLTIWHSCSVWGAIFVASSWLSLTSCTQEGQWTSNPMTQQHPDNEHIHDMLHSAYYRLHALWPLCISLTAL